MQSVCSVVCGVGVLQSLETLESAPLLHPNKLDYMVISRREYLVPFHQKNKDGLTFNLSKYL